MLQEIHSALEDYQTKWEKLVSQRTNSAFFEGLKPVSVGWKVADKTEYDQIYAKLHNECDRIVETWMNDRWIAKMHLRKSSLPGAIQIVKLMQRRPGSTDALGLDHVDFYSPLVEDGESILGAEEGLKWSIESNDVVAGYEWLSIWFDGTEAKLKAATVVDIVIQELQEMNAQIKA